MAAHCTERKSDSARGANTVTMVAEPVLDQIADQDGVVWLLVIVAALFPTELGTAHVADSTVATAVAAVLAAVAAAREHCPRDQRALHGGRGRNPLRGHAAALRGVVGLRNLLLRLGLGAAALGGRRRARQLPAAARDRLRREPRRRRALGAVADGRAAVRPGAGRGRERRRVGPRRDGLRGRRRDVLPGAPARADRVAAPTAV